MSNPTPTPTSPARLPSLPPALDARSYSGLGGAAIGLTLWILQTYVFRSHAVPPEVTSYVYIFVPAVAGYVASHLTRLHTFDPLRAAVREALLSGAGSVTVVPPSPMSSALSYSTNPTTQPHSASSPETPGTSQGGLSEPGST